MSRNEAHGRAQVRRRDRFVAPVLFAIATALVAVGACLGFRARGPVFPEGETGAYVIPQGSMSAEEAQAMIDEMAEESRITISVAPEMALASDGRLRVNLVVPEPNNGLSERIEVEQDGRVVYRSGIVDPGYVLEWGESSTAQVGSALATIYAVRDGADFGNPISVEVEVVGQ